MSTLLTAIRANDEAVEFLSTPGDFDLGRGDHVEEVHLASGMAIEGFAGDHSGGTYFFCGAGGEERPVLYADSEGRADLIAVGLPELLRLLLAVPWWQSCRDFTAEESRGLAEEFLEFVPDLFDRRDRVAAALGVELPLESEVLERLRAVVTLGRAEYTLIYTPEGTCYEPLFAL
ncbi:hypothetical protein NDR87_10460 [Nocardia sp. CDC159]|uniref:Uncharacterized protein n=1 Tax=Nocardia pulmonis TaxID=2951408 RepID=A0A9X2IYG3_9NOCA|nr:MULTISPECIES: hypothetical protein [Nocardia]MCM6773891.1 hypothetical protein [Nocardia pulmonis]MCM6786778.1 hypothetical protein [Nocardia sp. CDC159]